MSKRKTTPEARRAARSRKVPTIPPIIAHHIEAMRNRLFEVEAILQLAVDDLAGKPIDCWPALRGALAIVREANDGLESGKLVLPESDTVGAS